VYVNHHLVLLSCSSFKGVDIGKVASVHWVTFQLLWWSYPQLHRLLITSFLARSVQSRPSLLSIAILEQHDR